VHRCRPTIGVFARSSEHRDLRLTGARWNADLDGELPILTRTPPKTLVVAITVAPGPRSCGLGARTDNPWRHSAWATYAGAPDGREMRLASSRAISESHAPLRKRAFE